MFGRPEDLPDPLLVDMLRDAWGLGVENIAYEAVGFGSYHWQAVAEGERWFVTVDDLATKERYPAEPGDAPLRRLTAALETARALRGSGMGFVVAPIPTTSGSILETIGDRFAVALYPFIEGTRHPSGTYPTRSERLAVLEVLVELHAAPDMVRARALVDDFTIARRDDLVAALDDVHRPWAGGPFSEPARALVDRHADAVLDLLERHGQLAAPTVAPPERVVLTHGEPHRANTIEAATGVALIDWDTVLIAPPERDLWTLVSEDPSIADDYEARTGIEPDPDVLDLYRMAWDLAEIALYVDGFRNTHVETDDTREAWADLQRCLDPARW